MSCNLGLPILNNDVIRTEVTEDLGAFNQNEYLKRRDERILQMIHSDINFIYDASVDREWTNWKDRIESLKYEHFIISIDLGQSFLKKIHADKGYVETNERIDQVIADHNNFLSKFESEVGVHISEQDFPNRLKISYDAVKNWLQNL